MSEEQHIDGSSIGGHVDMEGSIFAGRDLNLTVQGITDADLDELAARILSALGADTSVTIAGGPDNKTVLLMDGEPHVVASREQGLALARRTAESVEAYLAGLVVHRDFGPWDTRYVPLEATAQRTVTPEAWAGYIPIELQAICRRGEGPDRRIERVTIPDIAAAVRDYPQFVLLGEPGAGKTTVLQKVALDAARARLKDDAVPVPFFVRLGAYRGTTSPFDFLAAQWRARLGTEFGPTLRSGSVFLLLDALNEMPRQAYDEQVAAWRAFAREWEGVRMVFTCRTLDYAPTLPLQQVEISRLDDARVRDFLARYVPAQAERLWEELVRHQGDLLDLARNPFLLAVLAWTCAYTGGDLPPNRGRLLHSLVDRLLMREEQRAHPNWIDAQAQKEALSTLAWTLQQRGEGTSMPVAEALQAVPSQVTARGRTVEMDAETVLDLGCAATILEETLEAQVRFYHHLVQELFAARESLRRFEAGENLSHLWQAPWWAEEMPEPEEQGEWDPLPPPPATGWEETTIAAAGLLSDADPLVAAVLGVNPVLAGRCLDEGGAQVSQTLRDRVRDRLLAGMEDVDVDLRARIAAGHVLGRLGDPRFAVQDTEGMPFILPPVVEVPGGVYEIGSPDEDPQAYEDEHPRHEVALAPFLIGRYPVTVGEYRCFVEAGGYEEERYWETEAARAWLRGEDTGGGAIESILETRQALLDSGQPVEYWAQEQSWTPQDLEAWQQLTSMSEEEAREALAPIYANRSRRTPAYWDEAAYTGANQPVVGVTWFEARAYCAWLTERLHETGCSLPVWQDGTLDTSTFPPEALTARLPTEAEWEAAARSGASRIYPWGDEFDPGFANTVEGRVLGTTPVGVYPQGRGPLGLEDGAGNVWEWTASLFEPYPYRPEDGREDPEAAGRRVLRGGSWPNFRRLARCAVRNRDGPVVFDVNVGFRVVFPGSLSDF